MKHKDMLVSKTVVAQLNAQREALNYYFKIKEQTYIYYLIDPITKEIRYVGKTEDPWKRLDDHINHDWKYTFSKRTCWIIHLLKQNLCPIMVVIDQCSLNVWQQEEVYWIAYFKEIGCDLLNSTSGGDGLCNPSQEVRDKISFGNKGEKSFHYGRPRPINVKAKISRTLQGHVVSQEIKDKISNSLKGENNPNTGGLTEEHKKAISDASIGNLNKVHAMEDCWSDPEQRQHRIQLAKDSWKNPEIRARRIEGQRKARKLKQSP